MKIRDDPDHNFISNVVTINLNVLHMLMKDSHLIIIMQRFIGEGEEMPRASRSD